MSYETLIVDQTGPIATITLNRPEARNALDFAMRRELLTALDEIEANPAARVVILTGAVFDAAEALRIGLVNRVVHAADLAATTRELAEKIAAGPPLALRLDKQALNRAANSDLAAALEVEALSQGLAIASDDHREGVAAFFDKRPPKFSGA